MTCPPSSVPQLPPQLEKLLEIENLAFIAAVDRDGNFTLFSAPGVEETVLRNQDLNIGAQRINRISSTALVKYEQSNCMIFESTDGGQASWHKFCW